MQSGNYDQFKNYSSKDLSCLSGTEALSTQNLLGNKLIYGELFILIIYWPLDKYGKISCLHIIHMCDMNGTVVKRCGLLIACLL